MTAPFKSRFTDATGNYFTVSEVIQTPVGLTVYYNNEATGQSYSCLLEAFAQRFKEVQGNDNVEVTDPTSKNKKEWDDNQRCC